ncbi:MAG: peptidoglycan DD-metalloendopeptidase family protein [Hamadaea sp.]|nr:peptidoglycan DD-metalloendopeptidase family protein [Hamadaea sp.]
MLGAAILLGMGLNATPAQAATAYNGVCESGEFCLYYNSDNQGSLVDFTGSVSNYGADAGCIKFVSSGSGSGQCVKNNAASAWNRTSVVVTVFYKSGYAGAIDNFTSGSAANLRAELKNENAGHLLGLASTPNLSTSLYKNSSARITAYFDGYLNTSGRHEGTDVRLGIGSTVYAMVSGTVVRVTEGARGSGGLSQLAIYNSSLNATLIYLHLNPSVGLGASISAGQAIGVEDWRGISSSGGAHTHVEMRSGRQTSASVSVGDPVLDNPNPTSWWRARGYNICCQFA